MFARLFIENPRGVIGVDEDDEIFIAREFPDLFDELDAPIGMQLENITLNVEILLLEQNFADRNPAHILRAPRKRRKTLEGIAPLQKRIQLASLKFGIEREPPSEYELDVLRTLESKLRGREILQIQSDIFENDIRLVEIDRLPTYDVDDRVVSTDVCD